MSLQIQFFLIVFLSLLFIVNTFSFLGYILSHFGKVMILSIISWYMFEVINRFKKQKWITTYKKAVLITGCDTGLGYATALELNELGYKVYATLLNTKSESTKQLVMTSRFNENMKILRMDVTNDREIEDVFHRINNELEISGEELWAVVNNAGIGIYSPIDWGTIDMYHNIYNVNTLGTVRVTRTFLPLLRKSKGHIINISSILSRKTLPHLSSYSMSKCSVNAFSDALRRENRHFGVKVSTIEPTGFNTSITDIKNIYKLIDNCWEQTSDDVKHFYKNSFNENVLKSSYAELWSQVMKTNINEVTDCVVDAIRNPKPKPRYTPGLYLYERFLIDLVQTLPSEIKGFLTSFLVSLKRPPFL